MNNFYFLFIFLSIFKVNSKVIDFRSDETGYKKYQIKEVCNAMGLKNSLMVDVINTSHIDCMGRSLKVSLFCKNLNESNSAYLRGFVDTKDKKVVCQFGKRAYLTLACSSSKGSEFCKDAYIGCKKLKGIYASELEVFHYSFLEDDFNKKELKCIYSSNLSEDEFKI